MATIYRFVIESKGRSSGESGMSGKGRTSKGAAKKGRDIPLFGGSKGGVEHNRYMRAINPLLKKITGGWWERGMRVGRAGMGLVKVNSETGKFAGFSAPAIAIIIAFAIKMLLDYQKSQVRIAEQKNKQNFKMLENGFGQINSMYEIAVAPLTGRMTYNQNK